ncbi:MFS transporter [Paenibacillus sp. FSL K6-2441]|uniref:MFS transporter n=1 Tax=Paenibacillus sp. FSL K6-2441 TaxID=2954679 RepID=UPI0030D84B07
MKNAVSTGTSAASEKLIHILAFTMTLSSMGATLFNIVLPDMKEEFGLSVTQVSWVTTIYGLIYAIGAVIYGKLADAFSLKKLLTFGFLLFCVGSLIGLSAQAYWMVLLGRTLQSAGASVVPAAAMIIPVRYFPAGRRGYALGITATGLAIGGVLGPVVSALLVSVVDWRWLFCVPMLMLVTLPFYRKYLSDEPLQSVQIDWLGGGLLAGTVTLLLLGVTYGGWELYLGSFIGFLLFVWRILRAQQPFVNPRLFRNKSYSFGLLLSVLVMGIGYALPFLTPQLLAEVNRLPAGWIGFAMVPGAAASAILGRKGGRLADTKGNAFVFYLASSLLISCFLLYSGVSGASAGWVAAILILGNVGQMFMQLALSNTISRTLPKEQTGVGMGMLSMLSFLSGTVAISLYGKAVDFGATSHWNPLNPFEGSAVYSNVALVLALLHIGILLFYRYYARQFGGATKSLLSDGIRVAKHE